MPCRMRNGTTIRSPTASARDAPSRCGPRSSWPPASTRKAWPDGVRIERASACPTSSATIRKSWFGRRGGKTQASVASAISAKAAVRRLTWSSAAAASKAQIVGEDCPSGRRVSSRRARRGASRRNARPRRSSRAAKPRRWRATARARESNSCPARRNPLASRRRRRGSRRGWRARRTARRPETRAAVSGQVPSCVANVSAIASRANEGIPNRSSHAAIGLAKSKIAATHENESANESDSTEAGRSAPVTIAAAANAFQPEPSRPVARASSQNVSIVAARSEGRCASVKAA